MSIKNAFCRRGDHRRSSYNRTFRILPALCVTLFPRRHDTAARERRRCLYRSLLTRFSLVSRNHWPHLSSPGLTGLPSARFPFSRLAHFPIISPPLFTPSHSFFRSTPSPRLDTFLLGRSRTKVTVRSRNHCNCSFTRGRHT